MGLLLTMTRKEDIEDQPRTLRPLEALAGIVFLVVIAGNIVQAFASTGPPPFMGQGDPVRFSFSPSHWVWSTEEWSPAPISLRGRWSIDKPDTAGLSPDPARGPLRALQSLPVVRQLEIGFPLKGTPTDLAYDAATTQFLITTQHGIYLADDTLETMKRYTIVDRGLLGGPRAVRRRGVPRQGRACWPSARTRASSSSGRATRDRRRRQLPVLPRVGRRLRRGVAVALRHRSRPDDVRPVGGLRPGDQVDLHGDRAEQQGEAAGRLAVRPARHDAVGGVHANAGAGCRPDVRSQAHARRVRGHRRDGGRRLAVRDQRSLQHAASDRPRHRTAWSRPTPSPASSRRPASPPRATSCTSSAPDGTVWVVDRK